MSKIPRLSTALKNRYKRQKGLPCPAQRSNRILRIVTEERGMSIVEDFTTQMFSASNRVSICKKKVVKEI
ncbi:hypothetical protein NPIL_373901 [Nephila pilipes]|uniref:Uncharacterized protein n=1 Tax=Nephila pilipes TaxID=299642 RepID=A0A8X6P0Z9_NEPPI|nr:hypothetical protein NPIL_373901 [Nephila pilipes]